MKAVLIMFLFIGAGATSQHIGDLLLWIIPTLVFAGSGGFLFGEWFEER